MAFVVLHALVHLQEIEAVWGDDADSQRSTPTIADRQRHSEGSGAASLPAEVSDGEGRVPP